MILADTSVWIQHFRRGLPTFVSALEQGFISMHTVVLGELASGNLGKRSHTLPLLQSLPFASVATTEECLTFLEEHALYGKGIGWNDLQLLAAARLSGIPLWSLDARLTAAAVDLGVAYTAS